jgi:hypothetical protein
MARSCAWLVLLAACASGDGAGTAAQADSDAPPSIFDVLDDMFYDLPYDVPDELLSVPDARRLGRSVSLREGEVTSAWTTAPAPDGTPSAMVYKCTRTARGGYAWTATPDAWLAPLGVDPSTDPDLLPFTARFAASAAPGVLFAGAAGPAFTLDAAVRVGRAAGVSHSRFEGLAEDAIPSFDGFDLPLLRIRKTTAARSGLPNDASFERPDFVLQLYTQGGMGPDVGTSCAPGEPEQRVPYDAQYWFVRLGNVTSSDEDAGAGGGGGSGTGGGGSGP